MPHRRGPARPASPVRPSRRRSRSRSALAPRQTTISVTSVADPTKVRTSVITVVPASSATGAWAQISAGFNMTCAITPAGQAYCWGNNQNGQLGDGTTTNRTTSVPVAGGINFASLASSGGATCGLTSDGTLHCWGDASRIPFSPSSSPKPSPTPAAVPGPEWKHVAITPEFACGVQTDGKTYCWGDARYGAFALRPNSPKQPPQGITQTPTPIDDDPGFVRVALSYKLGCGLRIDGALYCWGSNVYGRTGSSENVVVMLDTPTRIGCGTYATVHTTDTNSCAIDTAGRAFCWGLDNYGINGNGTKATYNGVPTAVSGNLTFTQSRRATPRTCAA